MTRYGASWRQSPGEQVTPQECLLRDSLLLVQSKEIAVPLHVIANLHGQSLEVSGSKKLMKRETQILLGKRSLKEWMNKTIAEIKSTPGSS